MKKKILLFIAIVSCLFTLVGCKSSSTNLCEHLIENREHLFVGNDALYSVTFSTGTRESNYNFDGVINEHVPFGILTLSRIDNLSLANDTYTYIVTINEETYTGFLEKDTSDNSYSADLEVNLTGEENVNAQISFTGYTFNKDLENLSSQFQVDNKTALNIAQKELKSNLKSLLSDKNIKIEVVMKIMKDYSHEELKNYYWYVGILATNGETLGILIDANSGDIIAKKV